MERIAQAEARIAELDVKLIQFACALDRMVHGMEILMQAIEHSRDEIPGERPLQRRH